MLFHSVSGMSLTMPLLSGGRRVLNILRPKKLFLTRNALRRHRRNMTSVRREPRLNPLLRNSSALDVFLLLSHLALVSVVDATDTSSRARSLNFTSVNSSQRRENKPIHQLKK